MPASALVSCAAKIKRSENRGKRRRKSFATSWSSSDHAGTHAVNAQPDGIAGKSTSLGITPANGKHTVVFPYRPIAWGAVPNRAGFSEARRALAPAVIGGEKTGLCGCRRVGRTSSQPTRQRRINELARRWSSQPNRGIPLSQAVLQLIQG